VDNIEGNHLTINYNNCDIIERCFVSIPDIKIFRDGFKTWPQGETPNSYYYNLSEFVNSKDHPLDHNRFPSKTRVFVSTKYLGTKVSHCSPSLHYRYEIYVSRGISSLFLKIIINILLKMKYVFLGGVHSVLCHMDNKSVITKHIKVGLLLNYFSYYIFFIIISYNQSLTNYNLLYYAGLRVER